LAAKVIAGLGTPFIVAISGTWKEPIKTNFSSGGALDYHDLKTSTARLPSRAQLRVMPLAACMLPSVQGRILFSTYPAKLIHNSGRRLKQCLYLARLQKNLLQLPNHLNLEVRTPSLPNMSTKHRVSTLFARCWMWINIP
jgi:hypothetical protein